MPAATSSQLLAEALGKQSIAGRGIGWFAGIRLPGENSGSRTRLFWGHPPEEFADAPAWQGNPIPVTVEMDLLETIFPDEFVS